MEREEYTTAPSYFVIQVSQDGDVSLAQYTSSELETAMRPDEYGDTDIDASEAEAGLHDGHYGLESGQMGSLFIIRGHLVKPKPVSKVTEWSIA